MPNEEQVGASHPEPCLGVLSRAVSRHSMQVKESRDRKAMSAAQCPLHNVLGRVSSYPGWALQGWRAALRMMSRWEHLILWAVSRHSMQVKLPSVLFGTEEFRDAASPRCQGHSFASTPQTADSLQHDKLARDWMISCGAVRPFRNDNSAGPTCLEPDKTFRALAQGKHMFLKRWMCQAGGNGGLR